MKGKGVEGEIVQVQGGHILRSTSQKDRHSKVYTAKGPRDRRVRLSANTAIQFYDLQDRLGYDRPSKAVDWLIDKAKEAIDKLDRLPQHSESNPSGTRSVKIHQSESSFIQPEPDTETEFINTSKSFFPATNSGETKSLVMNNFQNFHQDLGLSLHTLQDQNWRPNNSGPSAGSTFQVENYQRMCSWNSAASGSGAENRVGFLVESHAMPQIQQPFFTHNFPPISQREIFQSSYSNLMIQHNSHSSTHLHQSLNSGSHFKFGFQIPSGEDQQHQPEAQN